MRDGNCIELEQRVNELELLVETLSGTKDREELLDLPWAGNLGTWIWSVPSNRVICNKQKILNLGYAEEEIPELIGYEFFTDLLHPQDYDPVMDQMRRHLKGIDPVYEAQYRIRHTDGSWRWYYDRGKVTKRDDEGRPLQLVGIVFDITQQKAMEEQLERQNILLKEMVDHDALTRVLSRRAIFLMLEAAVARSDSVAVIMFDIDHFKRINDTYGHLIGDDILISVAHLMQQALRSEDRVGRYGGEEFLVVLERISEAEAMKIAERVRLQIQKHTFVQDIKLTISGGVAISKGMHADQLVQEADNHLYEAKRRGRDRIVGPSHGL